MSQGRRQSFHRTGAWISREQKLCDSPWQFFLKSGQNYCQLNGPSQIVTDCSVILIVDGPQDGCNAPVAENWRVQMHPLHPFCRRPCMSPSRCPIPRKSESESQNYTDMSQWWQKCIRGWHLTPGVTGALRPIHTREGRVNPKLHWIIKFCSQKLVGMPQ